MNAHDNISFIQGALDFLGIEHRDMVIVLFIMLLFIVFFILRIAYNAKVSCDGLTCTKARSAVEKTLSMDKKFQEMEKIIIEMKTESTGSHVNFKDDLLRFDRYLNELKTSSSELHGILLGGNNLSPEIGRRRIIHNDD